MIVRDNLKDLDQGFDPDPPAFLSRYTGHASPTLPQETRPR